MQTNGDNDLMSDNASITGGKIKSLRSFSNILRSMITLNVLPLTSFNFVELVKC